MTTFRQIVTTGQVLLLSVLLVSPALAGQHEVVLFQPGQSSWEWLLVPASHDGGKRMREGKSCLFCHEGEEKTIGKLIASGEKIEPNPIAGMPGFIAMEIDASYDDENLFLKLSWIPLPASTAWGDEDEDTRLTVSLATAELNVAPIAGCWAACHSDLPGMPDAQAGSELTKYLPGSRNKMTKTGGGSDIRAEPELAAQLAESKYLEYWQVVLQQGQMQASRDGYFLQGVEMNADSAVTATASQDGERISVMMVRPLQAQGQARHLLAEGTEYTLAVALHQNHASGRYHYTSFPMRFVIGNGEAELIASKK